MNSKELFHALFCNPVTEPFFDGIYARDQLESIIIKPRLVIVNTDPSYSKGEHWLLFFFRGQVVNFFDSLGRDVSEYHADIWHFVYRYSSQIVSAKIRIQPPKSDLCGQLCLYYAFKCCQGYEMKDVLDSMENIPALLCFVEKQFIVCTANKNCQDIQCASPCV